MTGTFPPFKLLEKLGGITMLPAVAQADLRNRNPQNYQRLAAFLELYDGTGTIANLDERLRATFEVPEIPGAGTAMPNRPTVDMPPPKLRSAMPPARKIFGSSNGLAVNYSINRLPKI